jgi:hypothetical protein
VIVAYLPDIFGTIESYESHAGTRYQGGGQIRGVSHFWIVSCLSAEQVEHSIRKWLEGEGTSPAKLFGRAARPTSTP